jgi:N-acyl-D-amino-acid deacylase
MAVQSRRAFLSKAATAGAAALSPWSFITCSGRQQFDLIVRGGQIADGLGAALYRADLGIAGDRIHSVGDLSHTSARLEISAQGLIVAPGFIDIHSHTDEAVLKDPKAESKIRQGVTLDVGGNCGDSPFPGRKPGVERTKSAADCTGFKDFAGSGGSARFALNAALFVGHATIRSAVLGSEARPPDAGELQIMKDLVHTALEQGAVGMSSGLEYRPSGYASTEELIELCKVVAAHNGVYATHMRSEDEKLVESVTEALRISRKSGVSLQISHLKASGKPNWPKTDTIIGLIEEARAEGLKVHCDRYPYLAYSTGMSVFFPGWAEEGGTEAFVTRLKDPQTRGRMKPETLAKLEANGGWETVMISNARKDANRALIGRRMDEIAATLKKDPYEAACDLMVSEGGRLSIVGFGMSEADTDRIIALPYTMIGSDGYAMNAERARRGGQPHPRSFGTFPRAIQEYVLNKKLVSMGEMIRKMTSLPADKLGFKDRGRLQAGAYADVVVFNPATIRDKATYIEPWQYPEGILHVLVNGVPVIADQSQTEALPGQFIFKTPGNSGTGYAIPELSPRELSVSHWRSGIA